MSKGKAEETRTTENVAGRSDATRRIGEGAERLQNRNFTYQSGANQLVKFRL